MPDFDLSITICSWNTKGDTRACLESLDTARHEISCEVIVLDNNSEDGSPDMVAAEFPWVRLIRMRSNLGFTGGQNHMLQERTGKHAFLLNSDTVVPPGSLRAMLAFLESRPDVGVVGPKVLNPDGSLQYSARRFPTPGAALFRNTPLGKLFPNNKFTRDYLMQDWGHDAVTEVDWVSGCALLARDSLLEKIGFLDPEYFMFSEDVDFCFRTWQANYKVVFFPGATITHAIGRSTDKAPNRMIGRFHRSMFRFYKKNMLPKVAVPLRPLALAGAGFALLCRASLFITKNKIDQLKRGRRR